MKKLLDEYMANLNESIEIKTGPFDYAEKVVRAKEGLAKAKEERQGRDTKGFRNKARLVGDAAKTVADSLAASKSEVEDYHDQNVAKSIKLEAAAKEHKKQKKKITPDMDAALKRAREDREGTEADVQERNDRVAKHKNAIDLAAIGATAGYAGFKYMKSRFKKPERPVKARGWIADSISKNRFTKAIAKKASKKGTDVGNAFLNSKVGKKFGKSVGLKAPIGSRIKHGASQMKKKLKKRFKEHVEYNLSETTSRLLNRYFRHIGDI